MQMKFVVAALLALMPFAASALDYKIVTGAGGVPINTVEAGDKTKPAIVLIHGFAQSHSSFKKQLESADLTRDFYLVAMDLRGHGNSGKPWDPAGYRDSKLWADDIIAVMDATGVSKAVLVGWSFGGFVVANVVEHYGTNRIAGINLVGSAGGMVQPMFPAPPNDPALAKKRADTGKLQMSGNIEDNIMGSIAGIEFLTAKPGDQAWQDLSRAGGMLLLPYVRKALAGRNLDNTKVVPKFGDVPVLVSYGSADGLIGPDQIAGLKKLGNVTFSVIEGSGHSPFYEDAPRFNRELTAFAKSSFAR
jgi:non-heme chloroperoxidase